MIRMTWAGACRKRHAQTAPHARQVAVKGRSGTGSCQAPRGNTAGGCLRHWRVVRCPIVVPMVGHRASRALRSSSVKLMTSGLALIAAYFVLAATTTIGDPSDIGGGLILLLGYLVTAGGLFLVARDLWAHRSGRQGPQRP
jgi:hypothetical protein